MKAIFQNPKVKIAIQALVSLMAIAYIGYKIVNADFHLHDFTFLLQTELILILPLLVFCNWFFESLKWKTVINTFQNISIKRAAFETLTAYTYGFISPVNSGNYARKIFYYPKVKGKKIVILNVYKGIHQMFSTGIFGYFGALYVFDYLKLSLIPLLILPIVFLVIIFLFRKKIITFMAQISFQNHLKLFYFSVLKHLGFSTFIWLLLSQQSNHDVLILSGVFSVYLLSSMIPIFNLFDFAIKGSAALFVFTPLGLNEKHILICYFVLWICNHALGALTGSLLPIYTKK